MSKLIFPKLSLSTARDFDGTDDYLDWGTTIPWSTYPFSFSVWIKPSSVSAVIRHAISQGHFSTDKGGFWFAYTSSSSGFVQMSFGNVSAVGDHFSSSTLSAGKWNHLTVTVSSSEVKFYFDGVLDATVAHSRTYGTTSHQGFIGAGNDGSEGQELFAEDPISDFKLWDIELSQAQVTALAASLPIEKLPVRYWKLSGGFPELDSSSEGQHADVFGTILTQGPHQLLRGVAPRRMWVSTAVVGGQPFYIRDNFTLPSFLGIGQS